MNNDEAQELEPCKAVSVEVTKPEHQAMTVTRLANGTIRLSFVNGYRYEMLPVNAIRLKAILEAWT